MGAALLETGAAQRIYMSPIIHISFLWCAAAAARYQNVTFLPCKKIEAENNKKRRTRMNSMSSAGGLMAIFLNKGLLRPHLYTQARARSP